MSSGKLAIGAAGIYAAYLINSLLTQKIYTYRYPRSLRPSKTDLFTHADLVQGISGIFCLLFALLRSQQHRDPPNPLPNSQVARLGILYSLNVNALNYALFFLPYPVRVVGDKLGYLSAVVVGVFFSRVGSKSHLKLGPQKIAIALMITVGTMVFSYFYQASKVQEGLYSPNTMWIGFLLLGISVTCQALFSDNQAYVKIAHQPTMNHLIKSVNQVGVAINFGLLLARGTLWPSLRFLFTHDEILLDITIFSSLTVLGQISIYYVVLNFKQHMFPLISTTRKVFTVLLSIYIYQHPMNVYLWMALVLVFGGISYELIDQLYYDFTGQKPTKQLKQTKKQ